MGKELWVLAETRDGAPTRATTQVLAAARGLAGERGLSVLSVLASGDRPAAEALARIAGHVLWLREDALREHDAVLLCGAIEALFASRGEPEAILGPSSARALEVLPRLAAACGGGYASFAVGLRWEGGQLVVRRPVYGGKVYEELAIDSAPALVTVRPGSFDSGAPTGEPGEVLEVEVELPRSSESCVIAREPAAMGAVDLSDAAVVVCGGRGAGGSTFRLVEELAAALGGAPAASRALVDAGERPHEQQVGKSGKTVSPELYVACGISGAIHHTLGMSTAKVVVAINTDPNAEIFGCADYGLVGDAAKIIPELISAIGAPKG